MKIENVYIKPDGQICACTMPVPEKEKYCSIFSPNYPCDGNGSEEAVKMGYCLCWEKMEAYEAALKACKQSAVSFEDQFSATILLHASLKIEPPRKAVNEELKEYVKNDTFYPLQCEVEIIKNEKWVDGLGNVFQKVARLIPEAKGHGFCEKPGHVCTMNYCDENGCQERKRVLLPEAPAPSDFKTARKFERFTAKDKESIAPIVEESQEDIAVKFAMYMCGKTSLGDEDWFRRTFKNNHWNVKITRKP